MKGKTYVVLLFLVFFLLFTVFPSRKSLSLKDVHGVNLTGVPSYGWASFWDNFESARTTLEKEFSLIEDLGLNLVEIYIPYKSFPSYNYWKLAEFMRRAAKHNLWVIVTLNDDVYPDNLNLVEIEKHIEAILKTIKDRKNLFAIGVMNEYNGRFGVNMSFAKWCIQKIREYAPNVKIVLDLVYFWHMPWQIYVGLDVDFYSFSIYSIPPFNFLEENYDDMLSSAEKYLGKPVILGEFGWRTDGEHPDYTEEKQAEHYRKVLETIHGKYGWLFWCLTDTRGLKEQWGIYTTELKEKQTAKIIREVLSGGS